MDIIQDDILRIILSKLPNKELAKAGCSCVRFWHFAKQEQSIRTENLINESAEIRQAVVCNEPHIIDKVMRRTRCEKHRIQIMIRAILLCIHYNNANILSKIIKNFPNIFIGHIHHILSLSDWPMAPEVAIEINKFAPQEMERFNDIHINRMLDIIVSDTGIEPVTLAS